MSEIVNPTPNEEEPKYKMVISRTTISNLGIKLYDKVSSVVAELVANSFDADAELVKIELPAWSRYLDSLEQDHSLEDNLVKIVVEDDGNGMTVDEVNEHYLKIGTNPRSDPNRGEFTKTKRRKRMGHKGIGKLAPFGICKKIEVITAGGNITTKDNKTGFVRSHFILNYDEIIAPTDKSYAPKIGNLDGSISERSGTKVILYSFFHKMIPDRETFSRQMSRLFLPLPDFSIETYNREDESTIQVTELKIDIDEDTKREIADESVVVNGERLPIKGWVARSKTPYKNPEMAGIRIYARGRLAAVTKDFAINSGFTGELTLRSYLVGKIVADWLDEEIDEMNDLTNTGRQDILWDSEKGQAFQKWGIQFLKQYSSEISVKVSKKTSELFMKVTDFKSKAEEKYQHNPEIVKTAIQFAQLMGSTIDRERVEKPEEGDNAQYLNRLAEFSLAMAPQRTIVEKLTEVIDPNVSTMEAIVKLFNDASMAEAESLGEIVRARLGAIDKLDKLLSEGENSEEKDLQKLIEESPWLIDPRWTVLQANRTFKSMKDNFVNYYKEKKRTVVTVSALDSNKRADFIFLPLSGSLIIVEIKKKTHALDDAEFERILDYYGLVNEFLNDNPNIKNDFGNPKILIICDDISLTRTPEQAYEGLGIKGVLTKKTWFEISAETKKAHRDFLDARDRIEVH
ncbi:MAG: ATP-binding protein [Thermoplasmatales archaeon]